MFIVNDDLSIYANRGDIVFFTVSADDNGYRYKFQPGDIVRMSIYGKKEADVVVMQKDFPVEEVTEEVFIHLEEQDTKIGESISKHKDYWYEVVLNPDTMPQTIIGYDEDGAKIFRLFPESAEFDDDYDPQPEDFPVVDEELDMTSPRPVANKAVAVALAKVETLLKDYEIKPEMFGAKGDGITDDTEAIEAMMRYAAVSAPVRAFPNEASCKDYTHITMKFNGQYLITKPMHFSQTYGVKIDGLNLVAGRGFEGLGMLMFDGTNRTVSVSNTTINGQFFADTCLYVNDYTLTTDFVNVELSQFKKYGFFADAKGHETKMTNVRITQAEWGRRDELPDLVEEGTGLYLAAERHDNNFTNLVVAYCHDSTVEVNGSANTFVNCHFYGGDVRNNGHWNVFQNCYFDGVYFYTMGFFTLSSCFFNRADGDTAPFIYLTEEKSNDWRYTQASINGTMFRATETVPNALDYGKLSDYPMMNTIGNTFYYVTPFVLQSRSSAPHPWLAPFDFVGTDDSGYFEISGFKFIWGTATANGFQEYPDGITLKNTFYIGCQRLDGVSSVHPFGNDIRTNKFYLNGTANGKVKWFVIGK